MRYFQIALLLIFALFPSSMLAQEDLLTQVDVDWKYQPNPEGRWSYSLGSIYRSPFYSSGKFDYNTEFLELNVAPKYSINSNHSISLIFRYRIKELFDDELTDEKRIVQQYNHSHSLSKVKLKGRLRIEQRFREKFNLRNRYRLGVSFPLNKSDNSLKEWMFTLDTEALWSINPNKSPTYDQRFTVSFKKPISEVMSFTFKPEFHYVDYTHDSKSIWRIYAILSMSL